MNAANAPAAMRRQGHAGAGVALIADDDEFFRVALRSVLLADLHFHEVVEVDSLESALERLGHGAAFEIALFDPLMAGMQSPANLRAVRECFPDLLVGIVSRSSARGDILLALEAGVHGYIPKDDGVSELTMALRKMIAGSIYVPPCVACLRSAEEGAPAPAQSQEAEAPQALTARQSDVLDLVMQGKSNKEIARDLQLAEGTIKVHMAAMFRNLGVSSRSGLASAGAKLLGLQKMKAR